MTQPPTLLEVRAWLDTPEAAVDDAQLGHVLAAEVELQDQWCTVPDGYAEPLYQAVLRRVGRVLAARGVPLGMLAADAEYGTTRLARWDVEIERLEGPYRAQVLA